MKSKKCAAVILAAVLLAAGVAALIVFLRQDAYIYIPPRPEDTALEYWICDDVSEVDWSGHDQVPGWFGASEFLGKGYRLNEYGERPPVRVSYVVGFLSDEADGWSFVTKIDITDPAVTVYGLTVNSDFREFRRVMESMGYEVETVSEEYIRAVRDDFTFTLTAGDSPELTVSVRVTYPEGIFY